MRYLLDSHILFWSVFAPEKLAKRHADIIAAPENMIYVSYASLWELTIKRSLGKLKFPDDFLTSLGEANYSILSFTAQDLIAYGRLPLHHRDPFDRMLIAHAQSQRLTLLTEDQAMKMYGDIIMLL